jgi:acyl-CoA reductase-like NAD-dependent aldehyde dehydrogenase
MDRFNLYIDGKFISPHSGRYFPTENPYTLASWAEVAEADEVDVDRAVTAADRAFRSGPWRKLSGTDRARLLRKLGDLILENTELLAQAEVRDNGKSITEMRGQMKNTAEWYYYYAGLADKLTGETIPGERPGFFNYTVREPLGVIAAVLPWNSPLRLAAWKLAPALAAGNTVVAKPSEYTSTSLLIFADLVTRAGFPDGVFNIVTGFGATGKALTTHPKVVRIAFTGGEAAGVAIYQGGAETLKHVSLELGGKSANIVFADANLEAAAQGAVTAIFGSTGQSCTAGSRLIVEKKIHDVFLQRVIELASGLRVGDPMDERSEICPITTRPQYERILGHIANAKADGAKLELGGGPIAAPDQGRGLFIQPTIFSGVTSNMRLAQQEVFGPVLAVMSFDDEAQALELANDSRYGLTAGVWTESIPRAHRVASGIEAGTVWVNTYRLTSQTTPYGGYKASGFGREGGEEMIKEYTQTKSVWINVGAPFISSFDSVAQNKKNQIQLQAKEAQ